MTLTTADTPANPPANTPANTPSNTPASSLKIGFDNEAYIKEQSTSILKRVDHFNEKLYLEFGGKIMYDYHAARVLPGFDPNVKMRLLQELKEKIDIILCVHAGAIEKKKIRADFGISYDLDTLRTIDEFKEWGLEITAVVITRYQDQNQAMSFKNKLERNGIRVYTHGYTKSRLILPYKNRRSHLRQAAFQPFS